MRGTALTILFSFGLPLFLWGQTDITQGTWYNLDKTGRVQFFLQDGQLSGKIIWLKDSDVKDKNNQDKNLRERPVLGLTNLTGFTTSDQKVWSNGKIYDPQSGKTYSSKITVVSEKELELRGYIGTPLLGRTTKFIRAD